VRTITNASGAVVECYDYLPFGRTLGAADNGRSAAGCHPAMADALPADSRTADRFTGKQRDEFGLDYFGARHYSAPLGRFMSPDPLNIPNLRQLKPELFGKVIANPQNWNAFSYAHNNPLNKMDPDGYLTIIVPGTWNDHKAWEDWEEKYGFKKQVEKTFGEKAIVLDNGGMGNTKNARTEAARKINEIIKNHEFAEGEKLNIVAHSHGGNAVKEATHNMDHKIDNLVTLGTPIRNDYIPDYSKIDNFLNVFSENDSVQRLGMGIISGARRTSYNPNVRNIDVTMPYEPGHSELWQNLSIWNSIIEPKLKR
jgi:RHS repeat-associated protein